MQSKLGMLQYAILKPAIKINYEILAGYDT
jgi:hypothetical protein